MIEILLSTYNGEKYLAEQLDSLLNQTVRDIRIRVRDDGSTDRTLEILRAYVTKNPKAILLDAGSNLGCTQSFLTLLKSSGDAEYYAFCDQDDVWLPNKLERAIEALKSGASQPALYASGFEQVTAGLEHSAISKQPAEISFRSALVESVAWGCTMVFNRAARDAIVSTLPAEKVVSHDWWSFLVVMALGEVIYDPRPSLKYRQHGRNNTGAPPTFLQSWRNRFRRLKSNRELTPWLRQAVNLASSFADKLPPEKMRTLQLIEQSQTNLSARVKLALSNKIRREKRLDDIVLRLLILFGAYSS